MDQIAEHARVERAVTERIQHDALDPALLEVAGVGAGLGTLLLLGLAGVVLVGVVPGAVPDVGLPASAADQQPGQEVVAVRRARVRHGRAALGDHGPDPREVLGADEGLVGVLDAERRGGVGGELGRGTGSPGVDARVDLVAEHVEHGLLVPAAAALGAQALVVERADDGARTLT
ncbi:MAG: hypothetical protein R3F59_35590 [Myxococcota bacterium]